MPDRLRFQALNNALESALRARMTGAGWYADPTGTGDGAGRFRRPLSGEFAVTAWFAWMGGEFPPAAVDSIVGVSYERAYRVWPYLLSGYPHSELQMEAQHLTGKDTRYVELAELEDVDRAVADLVQPVLDAAAAWAQPFASADALLGELRTWTGNPVTEVMDIPVILAASGRVEEARRALATAMAAHRDQARDLLADDFKRKFETWLAAGARPTPPEI